MLVLAGMQPPVHTGLPDAFMQRGAAYDARSKHLTSLSADGCAVRMMTTMLEW